MNSLKNILNKKKINLPLIIAEIGINHCGKLSLAKKIVDSALRSGVKAIKVQIHIPNSEMSEEAKEIKPGNSNQSIYEVIRQNSLKLNDEIKLKNYIKKKKLLYIATPFSIDAINWLKKNKPDIVKIGSGECNNLEFVKQCLKIKKPIIMSTGMNTLISIKKSAQILKSNKFGNALLYCVNLYPTNFDLIKLNGITELKRNFKKFIIGYSDHTTGILTCQIAIAKGANIIEKHFIHSKKIKGPDISSSADEKEMKILVKTSEIISKMCNGKRKFLSEENITRNFAFHSLVAKENILRGALLSKKNLTFKRPGNGDFLCNDLKKVLNKKVKNYIKANTQIKKTDLC